MDSFGAETCLFLIAVCNLENCSLSMVGWMYDSQIQGKYEDHSLKITRVFH